MSEPLTEEELLALRQCGFSGAEAELRELRTELDNECCNVSMWRDNSSELEICVKELKADNARLRKERDEWRERAERELD